MIAGLLLGAGVGTGMLVLARAFAPRPEPLAQALERLGRRAAPLGAADMAAPDWWQRLGRAAEPLASALGAVSPRLTADLRVTGTTVERHTAERAVAAVAGLVVPPVLSVVMRSGGVSVPITAVVVASVLLAVAGWVLPDVVVRDTAARRRRAFRHALSSYLDLVTVILAGGAGIETALEAAADAGDGWAFAELRGALARARVLRRSPFATLAELGHELGVPELVELAASVRLAGEQGARVRASMAARAASLRGHQLAEVEAAAQSASERMALPTVLMFVGFLVFIGYPALVQILGGSGL